MDVTVRSSTEHEQLRLFDPQASSGVPVWVRLGRAAWELVVSGSLLLSEWRPLVVEAVRERHRNRRTAEKAAAETDRLFVFLASCGVLAWGDMSARVVLEWCWATRRDRSGRFRRTAPATARNRQWIAGTALREASALGAPVDPDALVGERIPRPSQVESARPLTDDEDRLVKTHAHTGLVVSRRPVVVAAARSGGTASEIASMRMGDISLEEGTVAFRGTAARTCPMDEWSVQAVRSFVQNHRPLDDAELVCVTAGCPPSRAAHSVTVRLGQVLRDAGISGRPGVTARSIRLTAARKILDSQSVEAAARFLGAVSLDTVAEALGYDWRSDG